MTSTGDWLKNIRKRAKTVQESAKSGFGKFAETIEKKLDEVQKDLEDQRSKAEAAQVKLPEQTIWRPSEANPNGALETILKVPANVSLNPQPSPESPQAPTPFTEPITIRHKRRTAKQKSSLLSSSVHLDHESDSGDEQKSNTSRPRPTGKIILHCLNDIINEIIDRDDVEHCLNEVLDIIVTVDELIQNTTPIPTIVPQKDESSSLSDSISHSKDCIDMRADEPSGSETELDQENTPMNTSMSDTDEELMAFFKPDVMEEEVTPDTEPIQIANTDEDALESIQIKVSDEDLIGTRHITDLSVEDPDQEDSQLNPLPNTTEQLIDSSNTDDTFSTLNDIVEPSLQQSVSNENDLNVETLTEELEESFTELHKRPLLTHRPVKEPSELTALRDYISNIDDDDERDGEVSSPAQNIDILTEESNTFLEQLNTVETTSEVFPSPPISIADENISRKSSILSETTSVDEVTSVVLNEPHVIEEKRFSMVHRHSIPPGAKISHLICSSTYIYICTFDQKIFYAKLSITTLDLPLKWQQHSDLADQLAVSVNNRTIWRVLNKRLYSSADSMKFPPIGSQWNEIKLSPRKDFLSMSITDQCGWYIREDGTLWLIRMDDSTHQSSNVACPFHLNTVFCLAEQVGVTTADGQILIRVGCTNDCPEGDGWIFIQQTFGSIDDFLLLSNDHIISIVDKRHRLWIHQWQLENGSFEVLLNEEFAISPRRHLMGVNAEVLCFTDCEENLYVFSDCLTGIQWKVIEKNTRLQRLIGAFSDENHVWALTTDRMIYSSNGQTLEKPRQAQYLTHATFVPNDTSQGTVLWSLDESCNIYVRSNVENDTQWEQLDQTQFAWTRRLVHIVCNNAGVWAVDDQGYIHFRHGHISGSQNTHVDELAVLPPAWITIPGAAKRSRHFSHVFCGPADWMIYATDNKQNVYTRTDISRENRVGTSWKLIEDCSALELAISAHTLWLLTSCGQIQCRENISENNPIGTRTTTLPGLFLSLTVSMDDREVWALDSKRNLLKLDRLSVLFEK